MSFEEFESIYKGTNYWKSMLQDKLNWLMKRSIIICIFSNIIYRLAKKEGSDIEYIAKLLQLVS